MLHGDVILLRSARRIEDIIYTVGMEKAIPARVPSLDVGTAWQRPRARRGRNEQVQ